MSSADAAIRYAMHRLAAKTGIGYWTWWGLWHRKRKSVDVDLMSAVRGAYLGLCERQLERLQHTLAVEAKVNGDADNSDLVREAEALLARLKAARARQ